MVRHVDVAAPGSTAPLAGARCAGRTGSCACRNPGDDREKTLPVDGVKRFEIRMSADGGSAILEVPGLGRFETGGPQEACYYVDVPAGAKADLTFSGSAVRPEQGVAPKLQIAEYGPAGPWWYRILAVDCAGPTGRCDRAGADAWAAATVMHRKRGRLEPCGSAVVSKLAWDTSGGVADRDGGLYRDFQVRFGLEVKKFATQFAPGSTECIPK